MKLSVGFIKEAFRVKEKETGKELDCFIQDYEHSNGKHQTRFNIGINGWHEWTFIHYVDERQFNEMYSVVE